VSIAAGEREREREERVRMGGSRRRQREERVQMVGGSRRERESSSEARVFAFGKNKSIFFLKKISKSAPS